MITSLNWTSLRSCALRQHITRSRNCILFASTREAKCLGGQNMHEGNKNQRTAESFPNHFRDSRFVNRHENELVFFELRVTPSLDDQCDLSYWEHTDHSFERNVSWSSRVISQCAWHSLHARTLWMCEVCKSLFGRLKCVVYFSQPHSCKKWAAMCLLI